MISWVKSGIIFMFFELGENWNTYGAPTAKIMKK